VISGQNGQGKTNLLEAVYLLLAHRSFRATRLIEMIRFEQETSLLRGKVELAGLQSDLEVQLSPNRKRILIDGKHPRGDQGLNAGLGAVVFSPSDLHVPKGSPTQRRRLLDSAVAVGWPAYVQLYRNYSKTLQTRNRVLKEARPGLDALLDVYDQQLATMAGKVILARRRYVRVLSPLFRETFAKIMGEGHESCISYVEGSQELPETIAEAAAALGDRLRQHRSEDKARRTTSIGPHTHDLEFKIDGRNARQFASQGQTRALILSFKIAQIIDTYQRWQHYPLLLLDDVSSELDAEREAYLFDFIGEIACQTLITTTRPELITVGEKRSDFRVLNGTIQPGFL